MRDTGPDILSDPLFGVRTDLDLVDKLSLSEMLARLLGGGPVLGFERLAAEQRSYWWRFMVRCAAKALHELGASVEDIAGIDDTDRAGRLADALRAAGTEHAWRLHNADHRKTAFLQIPSPTEDPEESNYKPRSPSLLTAIIGSKNHERKVEQRRLLDPEAAVFALVEYQTGSIYVKRSYESQLMGSRSGKTSGTPCMGVRIGTGSLSPTFQHDVATLLDRWEVIQRDHGLRGDVWCLWGVPWDAESSLPASELDPAFIPLARAVRLVPPGDQGIYDEVLFRSSSSPRVDDHTEGGNLGDIFTPLVASPKTGAPKVRGTLESGYGYREVVRLLFGEGYRPAPSVAALEDREPEEEEEEIRVVFEGVAYDQGKTLGFHHRSVLLPDIQSQFELLFEPEPMRDVHEQLLELVMGAQRAVTAALRILVHGNPAPRATDPLGDIARERLDFSVDQFYLEHLFAAGAARKAGSDDAIEAQQAFVEDLLAAARAAFKYCAERAAVPSVHRLRQQVESEAYLQRRLGQLQVQEPHMAEG